MEPQFSSTDAQIPSNVLAQLESAKALMANAQNGNPEPAVSTPQVVEQLPAVPLQQMVTAPVVQQVVEDAAYWKQRFQVMEGKFKAEISPSIQLQNKIANLEGMIQSQQVTINSLNTMLASGQQGGPTPAPESWNPDGGSAVLDPDKFDHLGPEVVDLVKMVSNMAQNQGDQTQTIEGLKADKAEATKRAIWASLDRDVPQWREINALAEFSDWLSFVDPRSGYVRQDLISHQFQMGNSDAVAIFFTDFMADNPSLAVNQSVMDLPDLNNELLPPDTPIGGEGLNANGVVQVSPEQIRLAAIDYQQRRITEAQFMELSNKYQIQLKAQMSNL